MKFNTNNKWLDTFEFLQASMIPKGRRGKKLEEMKKISSESNHHYSPYIR
jgi:hypothetical protein